MEMLDDEVKRELRKLPFQIRIIDDVSSQRYLASILNDQFTWRGTKIDYLRPLVIKLMSK
ncbi:unnamed protein product [Commensalibacter communis]|uniref:hypothetical protein n=1 Tax=Commensalibacter communis TaxID=2972786 RepID=UPI0022FF87BE|nr:hypothetical protein [Commensalibacter communis]CAI3931683.1 unnamed protein product [Commensalibacter communis]